MSYIGIGYQGEDARFLRRCADECAQWLEGERHPRFFGDRFVILYDSNTAREFAGKCRGREGGAGVTVYSIDAVLDMKQRNGP